MSPLNEPDPGLNKYPCLYLISRQSTLNETTVACDWEMNLDTPNDEHPQEITMNLIRKAA